jgi:hypothetical protein
MVRLKGSPIKITFINFPKACRLTLLAHPHTSLLQRSFSATSLLLLFWNLCCSKQINSTMDCSYQRHTNRVKMCTYGKMLISRIVARATFVGNRTRG